MPKSVLLIFIIYHFILRIEADGAVLEGDFLLLMDKTNGIEQIQKMPLSTMATKVLPLGPSDFRGIDYDLKNNCVFWADNRPKPDIRRQCFGSNQTAEILHKASVGEFGRIAYDWVSQMIYFTNRTYPQIEVISTAMSPHRARLHRIVVEVLPDSDPIGIAIHPRRGYLFWTNRARGQIMRANLNGSDVRILENSVGMQPNMITVDFETERLFWTDTSKQNIASCDFFGEKFSVILADNILVRLPNPYALAISNRTMFWSDINENKIMKAYVKEYTNKEVKFRTSEDRTSTFMVKQIPCIDIRLISESIQSETNACSDLHSCSHACVGAPNNTYSCICPEGMWLSQNGKCVCPGSRVPLEDGSCPPTKDLCSAGEFECLNHKCVADFLRCDGDDDCGDGSDEQHCQPCPPHLYQCVSDGRCIPEQLKCDRRVDCADGSDEADCSQTIVNISFDAQQMVLHWRKPLTNNDYDVYDVYGGESSLNISKLLRTERLEAKLNLHECSKYIVGVSVADSSGITEHPHNWLRIKTKNDIQKPPNNPQMNVRGREIWFTWNHSCDIQGHQPPYYLFRINELTLNKSTVAKSDKLWYRMERIFQGAEYNFSVSTPADGAVPFVWNYKAPPLPAPGNFNIVSIENETYTFSWDPVLFKDETFIYELVAAKGTTLNGSTPVDYAITKDRPPISIQSDQLARLVTVPTEFAVGIRIRTSKGYRSPIKSNLLITIKNRNVTETQIKEQIVGSTVELHATMLIGWLIFSCTFIVGLVLFIRMRSRNYRIDSVMEGNRDSRVISWLRDDVSVETTNTA